MHDMLAGRYVDALDDKILNQIEDAAKYESWKNLFCLAIRPV
jgi:hypothetical protein